MSWPCTRVAMQSEIVACFFITSSALLTYAANQSWDGSQESYFYFYSYSFLILFYFIFIYFYLFLFILEQGS